MQEREYEVLDSAGENEDSPSKRVEKLFLENSQEGGRDFLELWEEARQSQVDRDGVFLALASFSRNNPHEANRFVKLISSDIEYISPKVVQKIIVDLQEDPPEIDILSPQLVSASVYNIAYKEQYLEEVIRQIDFIHPESFTSSVRTLDFLWRVLASSHGHSYATNNIEKIILVLKEQSENPESNFFLKKYADIILELSHARISPQSMNMMINPEYDEEYELDISELILFDKSTDETDNLRTVKDFKFISSPIFSQIVEKETGLDIKQLSLAEQFRVFGFLKNTPYKDVASIREFNETYSYNGFRTFLSIEQGGDGMGEKILELGKILPPESAEKIFEGYSNLVTTSEKIKEILAFSLNKSDMSVSVKEQLPEELREALMLRAKDILVGAHGIAREDITQFNTEDVLLAVEGVNTMLSIMADLPDKKEFDFTVISETEHGVKFRIDDKKNGYEYELKTFVRPKKEKNAQARINFELSFDTLVPNEPLKKAFFNSTISHKQNKKTESSTLRIGIDREDYGQKDGAVVSLDMGRAYREDDELSRTGDVLGNFFEEASSSHHTTETFSPEFADEELFASIAEAFLQYLKQGQKT